MSFLIGYLVRSILWYYGNLYYYWRKRMKAIIFKNQKEKLENYDANKAYKESLDFIKKQYETIYNSLKEPCKSAIKEERCLGCNKLENPDFIGDKECGYAIYNNGIRRRKEME